VPAVGEEENVTEVPFVVGLVGEAVGVPTDGGVTPLDVLPYKEPLPVAQLLENVEGMLVYVLLLQQFVPLPVLTLMAALPAVLIEASQYVVPEVTETPVDRVQVSQAFFVTLEVVQEPSSVPGLLLLFE
jgi:hypothetical protein